jgi:hypothetical protein
MSAASPVRYGCGWASATINVVTVEQPAVVGCLQVQPIETILLPTDMQPEVGRKQVPICSDTAPAMVDSLRKRLFLTVPAQAGLGQGSRFRVVLVKAIAAGAFSLAADRRNEQSRCPVPHTAREVLLPSDVIELLARHGGAVREQPVSQRPVQRLAILGQPTVQLGCTGTGLLSCVGALPVAPPRLVGAVRFEAARRPGVVLTVQAPLLPA